MEKLLERPLESLKFSDWFSQFMGAMPPRTNQVQLAKQAAVKYCASRVQREFSRVFDKLYKYKGNDQAVPEDPNHTELRTNLRIG